jgi:hypothetical protein
MCVTNDAKTRDLRNTCIFYHIRLKNVRSIKTVGNFSSLKLWRYVHVCLKAKPCISRVTYMNGVSMYLRKSSTSVNVWLFHCVLKFSTSWVTLNQQPKNGIGWHGGKSWQTDNRGTEELKASPPRRRHKGNKGEENRPSPNYPTG